MSVRKQVVLTMSDSEAPTVASCAATFFIVWVVSALTPPSTTLPSAMPPWPETMTKSPARTTGL